MKKITSKAIACLLAAIMLLSALPFSAFADDNIVQVYSAVDLREALAAGHDTIAVMSPITLDNSEEGREIESFKITQDTTIYLNTQIRMDSNLEHISETTGYDPIFEVEGAKLIIDTQEGYSGSLEYSGFGSAIKAIGSNTAQTAVIIYNGSLNAPVFYDYLTGSSAQATSLIGVENTTEQLVDISLYGGSYRLQSLETLSFDGPVFSGSGYTTTVKGGNFTFDPSAFVDPGYVAINEYDYWFVTALTEGTPQGRFAEILDQNGYLTVKRYRPEENEIEAMVLMEEMYYAFEEDAQEPVHFYSYTYNAQEGWAYASVLDAQSYDIVETRKVYFNFEYDKEIKAEIDAVASNLNFDENWETYYYTVNDLELINYWMTWVKGEYDPEADMVIHDDNVNAFLSYSGDFRKDIGFKNFKIDMRAGYNDMFTAGAMGIFEIAYNGTVYTTKDMVVEANHIIYVPNDATDLLSAAQKRIDDYLGEGKVTIKSEGNLVEYFLKKEYEYQNPDMTYEQWKESDLCPEYTAEELTYIPGTSDDFELFTTVINEIEHYLLIVKNSDAMVIPEYKSVDFSTEVSVATGDSSVPLDTLVEVNSLDDSEQSKMLEKLGVTEGESFDIKLHSGSIDSYVTKLDNGSFEVKLPVSENFKDDNLTVYYLNENEEAVEHPATVENGFATFTTNHFSIYTLASKKAINTDINGDGITNICDLVMLNMMALGEETSKTEADLNSDNKINQTDVDLLKQILL